MTTAIHFTRQAITVPPLDLPSREIGAVLEFQGLVREMEGESLLTGLFYEAYEPMARTLMERHLAAVGEIHRVDTVLFIHRLGWVPVGQASLYIRVLSSHRAEAMAFLAEAVIRLKQDVPIWKTKAGKPLPG